MSQATLPIAVLDANVLFPQFLRDVMLRVAAAFPNAVIARPNNPEGPFAAVDAKDRHVAVTALAAGATRIITWNLQDFPRVALAPHGIEAIDPDSLLSDLFRADILTVRVALERHRQGLNNPPLTGTAYDAHWIRAGLPIAAGFL